MTGNSFVRRVGQGILACALFLVTLEACARFEDWWRWSAPFFGRHSSEVLQITDEIGTRNRPGARFEKWQINSAGFRGPELSLEKATGTVRVGIAGASEVFGLYESPEKDVTAQLRARLDAEAPGRFEVVNLASAGMSPPRIAELVERWAGRFDFDLIVIYPTPAFYLDVAPPARWLPHQLQARAATTGSPAFSLRLSDKVWRALRQRMPAPLQAWLKRREVARERRRHAPEWVWTGAPRDRVELFAADLSALAGTIRTAGTSVMLATHAHRFSDSLRAEEGAQMDGWIRFYPRATATCLIEMERQAKAALYKMGQEQGLPVVDVQEAVGKDARYYADFSHFTDEGAARAAEALAAAILTWAQDRSTDTGRRAGLHTRIPR